MHFIRVSFYATLFFPLVYVDIGQFRAFTRGKKLANKQKYSGFSYSKNIANYDEYSARS